MDRFALPSLHRRVLNWYFHSGNYEMARKLVNIHFERAPKLQSCLHYIVVHWSQDIMYPSSDEPKIPDSQTLEAGLKK